MGILSPSVEVDSQGCVSPLILGGPTSPSGSGEGFLFLAVLATALDPLAPLASKPNNLPAAVRAGSFLNLLSKGPEWPCWCSARSVSRTVLGLLAQSCSPGARPLPAPSALSSLAPAALDKLSAGLRCAGCAFSLLGSRASCSAAALDTDAGRLWVPNSAG